MLKKIHIIIAIFAAIVACVYGFVTKANLVEFCLRVVVFIIIFYVIGLFVRGILVRRFDRIRELDALDEPQSVSDDEPYDLTAVVDVSDDVDDEFLI